MIHERNSEDVTVNTHKHDTNSHAWWCDSFKEEGYARDCKCYGSRWLTEGLACQEKNCTGKRSHPSMFNAVNPHSQLPPMDNF